jgi:hypothetical protein
MVVTEPHLQYQELQSHMLVEVAEVLMDLEVHGMVPEAVAQVQ